MKNALAMLALAAAALPLSGCLIMSDNERVVGANDTRQTVEFASEEGFVTFYNAVRRNNTRGNRDLGESSLAIPFLLASNTERRLSYNAYHNNQIQIADVNGDGLLSDLEVRAYAGELIRVEDDINASVEE